MLFHSRIPHKNTVIFDALEPQMLMIPDETMSGEFVGFVGVEPIYKF